MSDTSYRQIVKATGIFGGVQFISALAGLIKTKFVAVLLGPEGIGINGLLVSTVALINSVANLGLQSSAIREVAEAGNGQDEERVRSVVSIVRRFVWLTGILALLVTLVFSSFLSRLVFDSDQYTIVFMWLSLALFFDQLSSGQLVILQGLRKINYLAKANIAGSVLGLAISVPLYYLLGVNGITPAIILSSLCLLLRSWYFTRKVGLKSKPISWGETFRQGGDMVRLGIVMALTGFIGIGTTYLIKLYLSRFGGVDTVGYYNAAFVIVENYVGMIFAAMATDYFPRLSAVNRDNRKSGALVNEQGEISLILLFPVLMILVTFAVQVVWILYSSEFLTIVPMMRWAVLGILMKAAAFPFGYVYIAKGDKIIFLVKELFSWGYIAAASVIGYRYWGLEGLGAGYLIAYLLSFVQTLLLCRFFYGIKAGMPLLRLFAVVLAFSGINLWIVVSFSGIYTYIISVVLILLSACFSYRELNKRLDLKGLIRNKLKKKNHDL